MCELQTPPPQVIPQDVNILDIKRIHMHFALSYVTTLSLLQLAAMSYFTVLSYVTTPRHHRRTPALSCLASEC